MNGYKNDLYEQAVRFIEECYSELERTDEISERSEKIRLEIESTGTYEHTFDELVHGARMAWRNSNRCIGRLFWSKLTVMDAREANDEEAVLNALLHHIDFATNEGKIRPVITVFKKNEINKTPINIMNHQLIRYAGYESDYGVIGDPASIAFTNYCRSLGWEGEKTAFDILPLVFSVNGRKPVWRKIPIEKVKEVPIEHPEMDFSGLGVKWYAVPIISDMDLKIGGITYGAAPFNGWYMGTEIGARNFADPGRYHLLPAVAEIMGIDTGRNASLWKDRALTELNVAVLHSFNNEGVSIVDHHTAAQQFQLFEKQEARAGRMVTGNWVWLIPPLSPATTHIFHKPYPNKVKTPNYFHRKESYPLIVNRGER
ncbi:nitric oxide synthase oxygenase [Bacillus sp. 1P06AnD]|uniref:nitric oxide synthase oxygenase n=1 Tax=Bacillus sp. 1P06AnD TaxID=3132208 RepID=UPI0039A010F9